MIDFDIGLSSNTFNRYLSDFTISCGQGSWMSYMQFTCKWPSKTRYQTAHFCGETQFSSKNESGPRLV